MARPAGGAADQFEQLARDTMEWVERILKWLPTGEVAAKPGATMAR